MVEHRGARRYTRKTDSNHVLAVALHFLHYNFVGFMDQTTPAMAAGVTDKLYDLDCAGHGGRGVAEAE